MNDKPLDCVATTGPVGKHDFQSHASTPDDHLITPENVRLLQWASQNPEAVAAILAGEAVVMPARIGRDRFAQAAYHKPHGGGFFVNIDDTRLDKPGESA